MSRAVMDLGQAAWTLRNVSAPHADADVPADVRDREIPATVPGCVHTDLMAAGLIEDPYVGLNEPKTLWIGRAGWRYEATFTVSADLLDRDRVELACDGLDTLATVELNGQEIGRSFNMHVRSRFDAKAALREGENRLAVTFDAPLPYAEKMNREYGPMPQGGNKHPYNLIRKLACNFGWDWGPDVTTSGIWRPIRLEAWDVVRLGDVRPLVTQAGDATAEVDLRVAVATAGEENGLTIRYRIADPEGNVAAEGETPVEGGEARATITVDWPRLWWPSGHGGQPLYELRVQAMREGGEAFDETTQRLGLRQVELVLEPDAGEVNEPVEGLGRGESMALKVNGRRIFCKGANWIPDDCFPSRVTRERYRERIEQALGANMNILRVWGGGLYESEDFYELCTERGMMVWQDFLCACASYPESGPYPEWFEAEARDNVSRLSKHTSLVLWNGNNENFWGYCDWGWQEVLPEGKGWGTKYYLETFPKVVAELDASRPYWPGSPYSNWPNVLERHPNLNEYGNRHIWDVWHGPGHYSGYLKHFPRFSSEFGFHGPPTWPTIEHFCPPEQRRWDSEVMKLHNKNGRPGQEATQERMADDFDPPTEDFEAWLYLAQVMQARALSMGVEWFRALSPWNSGALYWQLNDCYPVSSWAAIDGYGRPKPLLQVSKRFFAPRLVSIRPRRVVPKEAAAGADMPVGPLSVYLHNDSPEPWRGTLVIRRLSVAGKILDAQEHPIDIAAWKSGRHAIPDGWATAGDATSFLTAEMIGDGLSIEKSGRAFWWSAPDKAIEYPMPAFDLTVSPVAEGFEVVINARTLLRDVCIFVDRLDASAVQSDQAFTMLPGDQRRLRLQTRNSDIKLWTPEWLSRAPVFRCANDFGRRSAK